MFKVLVTLCQIFAKYFVLMWSYNTLTASCVFMISVIGGAIHLPFCCLLYHSLHLLHFPFPSDVGPVNPARGTVHVLSASPAGAEMKSNMVHFLLKSDIWWQQFRWESTDQISRSLNDKGKNLRHTNGVIAFAPPPPHKYATVYNVYMVWFSGNGVRHINEVILRRAR